MVLYILNAQCMSLKLTKHLSIVNRHFIHRLSKNAWNALQCFTYWRYVGNENFKRIQNKVGDKMVWNMLFIQYHYFSKNYIYIFLYSPLETGHRFYLEIISDLWQVILLESHFSTFKTYVEFPCVEFSPISNISVIENALTTFVCTENI